MYRLIPYVQVALEIYYWLIIIRVMLSWIPRIPYNQVIRFIYEVTEPVLAPIRRLTGRYAYVGLAFSPVIALILLRMLESVITRLLLLL